MANFLLLNGPNLNLLGTREPEVYGKTTLNEIVDKLSGICTKSGHELYALQSNAEHELVDCIHDAKDKGVSCVVFNPGAFTHTSISIRDAILGTNISFIEVHISNIFSREEFRKESYFSDIAEGVISGLGFKGYELALKAILEMIKK